MARVWVAEGFDAMSSPDVRFLQEAARLGELHVLVLSDSRFRAATGAPPRFPREERLYLVEALRWVADTRVADTEEIPDAAPGDIVAVRAGQETPEMRRYCAARGLSLQAITEEGLSGFPDPPPHGADDAPGRRKVLVTGCYDWFHSGHVRFFEEVSALGDLFVVVGNDANVRLLKGEGHPLFPQEERRYMAASVRFVRQALISTGMGWMDAEPEIARIQPDVYAVNMDGDKEEKREFCRVHGIRYVVLRRAPREGLPRRTSTDLRGF